MLGACDAEGCSLLNRRDDAVPEVPAIGTEAGPCFHARARDKGVRQVALRALEVGPRRGLRPEFHGDEVSENRGGALFRIEHVALDTQAREREVPGASAVRRHVPRPPRPQS